MSDIQAILDERGRTYGRFEEQAAVAQSLKAVVRENLEARNKVLEADMAEGLDQILHKIARIVNGDPWHVDSWRDIAGYATLVADRLEGNGK